MKMTPTSFQLEERRNPYLYGSIKMMKFTTNIKVDLEDKLSGQNNKLVFRVLVLLSIEVKYLLLLILHPIQEGTTKFQNKVLKFTMFLESEAPISTTRSEIREDLQLMVGVSSSRLLAWQSKWTLTPSSKRLCLSTGKISSVLQLIAKEN